MHQRVFVGFGFGAIQGGLFLYEASRSGNFDRLVVAEVMPDVVEAVGHAGGRYHVNVATRSGLERHQIEGVEVFNPQVPGDRERLIQAVAEAKELATALPSVNFFDKGDGSAAAILAAGLRGKLADASLPPGVLYAGENHNHAAEILEKTVRGKLSAAEGARLPSVFQALNTVIGKMSKVVADPAEIAEQELAPITRELPRAFLVEEFNRILISRISLPGFRRGIEVFEEKSDLLPFEEAKLYGHNATHALIGYLARRQGCKYMSDAGADRPLMALAREAFLEESGRALIARRAGVDPLFTTAGYRTYADDLLERMVNPWLRDAVDRIIRDPRRKLAWDDRLIGTMRLALSAGVTPYRFATGAAAALDVLVAEDPSRSREQWLDEILAGVDDPDGQKPAIQQLILRPESRPRPGA